MKKFLLSLLAIVAVSLTAGASTATILTNSTASTWTAGTKMYSTTIDGFNLSYEQNTSNTAPVAPKTDHIRIYKNFLFKISRTDGAAITKVVMHTISSYTADMTVGSDTAKADETALTITWSGSSTAFSALAANAQVRIKSIDISYGTPAAVEDPAFSPAGGTFYANQNVTISCATAGASIFYTTDGTAPTTASSAYTAAIPVTLGTTTIKAIASKGTDLSSVVSATYVVKPVTSVSNIAGFVALDSAAAGKITNPITAIFQSGSNLYVKDSSGYLLVYGAMSNKYNNGDVIPAGASGVNSPYNGIPEMQCDSTTFDAGTAGTAVEPTAMTIANLKANQASILSHYIAITGATLTSISGKNFQIHVGTDSIAGYNNLSATIPTNGGTYTVQGFVSQHNGVIQIAPSAFINEGVTVAAPTFDPAAGTYTSAQSVSLESATDGAMIYYTTDGTVPSASSKAFTSAIAVDSTMTIKAIAILDGSKSDVASATYKIIITSDVASISDFAALADNAGAKFTNHVIVTAQTSDKKYTFVKDDSGAMTIFGTLDNAYTLGNVIPSGFIGTKSTYNKVLELVPVSGFSAATSTVEVTPEVKTIASVTNADQSKYVKFENVNLDTVVSGTKTTYYLVSGTDSLEVFNKFGITMPTDLSKKFDATGVMTVYSKNLINEFYPTIFEAKSGVAAVTSSDVKVIAGVGEINVIGQAKKIEVYTVGGALISLDQSKISCAPGLYIVRTDNKVAKVIVK
jgi:hypothetical protein